MFLVAILAKQSSVVPPDCPGMWTERVPINEDFECCLHPEVGRYDLATSSPAVTLRAKDVPDGDLIRIDLTHQTVLIRKPLLLGLPLYYSATPGGLAVSTHVRLLQKYGVVLHEDPSVMPEYLVFRYVTPPRSLFRGISSVPIGGSVRVRLEGGRVHAEEPRWTDVFRTTSEQLALEVSALRIKEDLEQCIEALDRGRDGIACLLSGGVDSSILFKISQRALSLRESHSTGYPFEADEHNDERKYAESAAAAMGSNHQYHRFSMEEFLGGVVDAIEHAESPPIALQSVLLGLVFNRRLGRLANTILCGQGADALFGLSIMYEYFKHRRMITPALSPAFRLLSLTIGDRHFNWPRLYSLSKRKWDLNFQSPSHGLWLLGEFADKEWLKKRLGVDGEASLQGRMKAIAHFDAESVLDAFSILDFVSDVAAYQDIWGKLGSSAGTRVVFPFNSPGLMSAAFNTPWAHKLAEPKLLIRRVGEYVGVPDFILWRPKRTFGISPSRWARRNGMLERLFGLAAPVFDRALLSELLGDDNRRAHTCLTLVSYAIWKLMFIDGEPADRLRAELTAPIN